MTPTGAERVAAVPPALNSERARELARVSVRRRRRRLALEDVERELPPMDTPEHVRAALQVLQRWTAAGMLTGVAAGACVRAAEVWLKVHEHELDRQRMKALEQRVRELEGQLAQRPRLGRVP